LNPSHREPEEEREGPRRDRDPERSALRRLLSKRLGPGERETHDREPDRKRIGREQDPERRAKRRRGQLEISEGARLGRARVGKDPVEPGPRGEEPRSGGEERSAEEPDEPLPRRLVRADRDRREEGEERALGAREER